MLRTHSAFAVLLLSALVVPVLPAFPAAADAAGPGAVCDHQPVVHPTAPAGAVVVDPAVDSDLGTKTRLSPPGSTFWLAPGTHTLGTDAFGQVIPKDGDVYLGAPGAVLDGRGVNQAAFTQLAKDVVIDGLTIQNFVAPQDQGVVNHDSGEHWIVENSTVQYNRGAALMAGVRQEVRHNCLRDNGQYGMNAYRSGNGITGLIVEGNEVSGNNVDDWETRSPGCGCSGGIKFWSVNGADIRGNWVHHNHGAGLWADTNDNDFLIENNLIEDNDAEAIFYEISYNLVVRDNVIRRNTLVSGRARAARGDNFPAATIYLSEAGGEPRVPARTTLIDIYDNVFEDNWSGVTLWENADRFCNSPANTSTASCTRLVADPASCAAPGITTAPLYDDCRWKTQRVEVHDNTFAFDPAHLGCTTGLCGRMAVLSNYGTYPAWSPYKGTAVQEAITHDQGNYWFSNTYRGPWTFVAGDTSRTLTPEQWQAVPYYQDDCASFDGVTPRC
ncbi:right-handed parallel beta-helix repeat-containing protein [Amycolatopsis sp. H20-H5]|uniref:right-handed parallel beta-helix repeat-containing protein n=1 Tax=Amycolatopsis sp. H20-H5 TaxID=3046309 RepID=UPI002DBFE370|nr:right-handed parallel beta-helix repeat-containing protein [Amycolatopsis sp. H20-H5]MEC3981297.1 right-handed parallel beta-helix repeat-containing protein [Amycolatopsis sp. H20-H5]